MAAKRRAKVVGEFGTVAFSVKGPIPRTAPYKKGFRGRLYVPDDVKAWRRHIASNFLLVGGRKPLLTEQVMVTYTYTFVDNHADHDSITHSAQDGLSKDALKCDDKEWWAWCKSRRARAVSNAQERLDIQVEYLDKEKCD